MSSFSKETEIFYFLLRTTRFLQSQRKEPRQYALMTKKYVTSCRSIWRCLFVLDRWGNESFVLMLPILSGILSMNNVVKECPNERTVSFSILSITDLKTMYIRVYLRDHKHCSASHIYWSLTTSAVDTQIICPAEGTYKTCLGSNQSTSQVQNFESGSNRFETQQVSLCLPEN